MHNVMELDDLKTKWQNSNSTSTSTSKKKIMELSQQKSYGPVASLKTALGKQVVIIPFLFVILLIQVLRTPSLQTDPFFGLFVGIIVLASIFFSIAYFILRKMSRSDAPVAIQLKRQLHYLQQMLLCYRLIFLAGVVVLVIFLEAFKNMGTAQLMQPWYEINPGLRICAYAGLVALSFFLSRSRFHKDFGKHLDELKKNLSDTE